MSPNYFLIATALVVMDVWLYSESVFGCTCTIDTSIQLSHTIILLIAIVSFLMKLGSTCTLFCNKHDVIVQLATRME